MSWPQRLFLATILISPWACQQAPSSHQAQYFVFGTMVDVELIGISAKRASQLLGQVNQQLRQQHRDWHAWQPGELDRLNQALAAGAAATVGTTLRQVLMEAQQLEHRSHGHFNPAIGNLVRLWGFHTDQYPILSPPPPDQAIRDLLKAKPSLAQLRWTEQGLTAANSAIRIDLGGFAKGVAVDRAIATLQAAQVPAALINAGGDLRAYGHRGERPWRVALRDPSAGQVLATIEVRRDEAIFTSGNYARYGEFKGQRYAHIIDPGSGYPVDHIVSATVIHERGAVADAAATALVVAGPDRWATVAADMGIQFALLIDQQGCLHLNPAMLERLSLSAPSDCRSLRHLPPRAAGFSGENLSAMNRGRDRPAFDLP